MDKDDKYLVRCLKCRKVLECSRYNVSPLLQHIRSDHPEVEIIDDETNETKRNCDESWMAKNVSKATSTNDRLIQTETKDTQIEDDNKSEVEESQPQTTSTDNNNEIEKQLFSSYMPEEDLIQLSDNTNHFKTFQDIKDSELSSSNTHAQIIYTHRCKIRTPSAATSSLTPFPKTPRKRHFYRISIQKWQPASGSIYCPKCGCHKKPLIETRIERFTQNEWCAKCLFNCWPLCFMPWLLRGHEVQQLHCSKCKAFLGIYNPKSNCLRPNGEFMSPNAEHQVRLQSDGRELHPDMVARLEGFKRYGRLAGIDLEEILTDSSRSNNRSKTFMDDSSATEEMFAASKKLNSENVKSFRDFSNLFQLEIIFNLFYSKNGIAIYL
ncbi:uncharacterized protein LOC106089505 [Stomoxys calcitrans]|uniref:uncharacterized protein LOC106089505 n=1 Tax=Stomoxys calcitrans TaxID=35570 RepID=UPI0027E2B2C8|nr:uncharacterized protein LOC106089505 [Stomoxys calcitrans]